MNIQNFKELRPICNNSRLHHFLVSKFYMYCKKNFLDFSNMAERGDYIEETYNLDQYIMIFDVVTLAARLFV